jgi:hypothetical protein
MYKRNTRAGVTNYGNAFHFLTAISLALGLAFMCPGLSSADYPNHNGQMAADRTLLAANAGTPPGQGQGLDPEMLEILKARKAALGQERSQIERDLAAIIRVGIEQEDPSSKRTKRAICKVNQDLEAIIKRLALHQEKRDAFERDWDAYYVSLRDSAGVKSLTQKKQALDWDRTQIEEKLSELVRKHDQQIEQEKEIRWYQVALREIDQQLVGYRKNRDAFERDWEAFYSSIQE